VSRHLGISAVDYWLVEACLGDARPQVVGDNLRRDPAEGEGPRMRTDPVDKALREGGFRMGVAGGAERGDEQLADAHLTGRPVHHLQRRAGIVHEHPLAGDMQLPHGRRQTPLPGAVKLAVAAIPVSVRVRAAMLLPQQRQRHARPAQLAVDRRPVRLRSQILRCERRRVQKPLQRLIAQILGQRPAQAGPACPPNAVARRRCADRKAGRDLAFGHAAGMKPQHVAYLAHG
jgi:hypothetical protein